jgi:mRNA interferase MazF
VKKPGQVVLFRFPRTDLVEGKLRPALLISEAPGPYDDWLICMISSQLHQQIEGFDELIEEGDSDFQQSGLKKTSVMRISPDRMQRIRRRLAEWIREGKEN